MKSLDIGFLNSKSWVVNEFLDVLTCYDIPEQGLDKLILNAIGDKCDNFEEEVLTRLANMCPQVSHLQLSNMSHMKEEGRI